MEVWLLLWRNRKELKLESWSVFFPLGQRVVILNEQWEEGAVRWPSASMRVLGWGSRQEVLGTCPHPLHSPRPTSMPSCVHALTPLLILFPYSNSLLGTSCPLPHSHIFLNANHYRQCTSPFSQSCGFSSSHVQMWDLDHKESWVPKNWCFWTVVLEKTLESPLVCKEIRSVHSKGDQSWVFIGRTDVEAEAPILWSPDVKSQLFGKDPDAWKDWGQKEKGATEAKMVGWHHWINGHEFE